MSERDIANMEDQRLGGEYTTLADYPKTMLPPERSKFVMSLSDRLNPNSEYQRLIRERALAALGLQESSKQFDHWRLQRDRYKAKLAEIKKQLESL